MQEEDWDSKYLARFQMVISVILSWIMAFVVLVGTVELIYYLIKAVFLPPIGLQIDEVLSFFGMVLLMLIGVELLDTFKHYHLDKTINVQTVLLVVMIAVARKIVLELEIPSNDLKLAGMAAVLIALAAGFYLVKKAVLKFEF